MNKELNIFTLRMLRDQYEAEHLDTEVEALDAAISVLETDGDLISRQAAIDALKNMCSEDEDGITVSRANVDSMLRVLPSAQPEIIRCKDCVLSDWYTAADGERRCYCMHHGSSGHVSDDFCSYGQKGEEQ